MNLRDPDNRNVKRNGARRTAFRKKLFELGPNQQTPVQDEFMERWLEVIVRRRQPFEEGKKYLGCMMRSFHRVGEFPLGIVKVVALPAVDLSYYEGGLAATMNPSATQRKHSSASQDVLEFVIQHVEVLFAKV